MFSLKNKILLGLLAILIGIMLVAFIAISLIISRQSRQSAERLLQNTFNTIRYSISEQQGKLLFNCRQMATLDDMGGKIKYIVDSSPYFKYSIMRPAYIAASTVLYNIGSSADIWKAAIYSLGGELISFAVFEDNTSTLGYVHNQETIEVAYLKAEEKLLPESWAVYMAVPDIGIAYDRGAPVKERVNFSSLNGLLCLTAHIPIMGKDYNSQTQTMELKPVAMLVVIQKLGSSFARRMADLTGTEINIFGTKGLIAGTKYEYKEFSLERFPDASGQWSLITQKAIFNDIKIGKRSYFQGVLPVYSGTKCIAAVTSLYSKRAATASTARIIQLLSLIYIVFILLIVPAVIFVVARWVINPIQKMALLMRQITHEKDFNKMLEVETKDEIGQLAMAFNTMTQDLKNTTTSVDNLNREVAERKKAEEELTSAYDRLKETQAQLVQSAKMASIGQLAGGVAHEINNPLTGVINNIQLIKLMQDKNKDLGITEFNEILGAIEESALRCKKITQSLLDFSRASKGLAQPVCLNEAVNKVISIIEYEMKLENIAISAELDKNLPKVSGDIQLLQQVIFDIISNAKWAIENKPDNKNGRIIIKTAYSPDTGRAVLSIFDNGIGISKENITKVFDPFFTTKPIGEGTGLGLSIAYNIIKEHKGEITAESKGGEGTTFIITLPVVKI